MPELTHDMRKEAVIAEAVARSKGITLSNADQRIRALCHVIARSVMPGVDLLIQEAEKRQEREAIDPERKAMTRRMAKAYKDGFADGERGRYSNLYEKEAGRAAHVA